MKELSIEDKAKRYDEVLAMAKEQHQYPWVRRVRDVLEEFFPELKESDDERIKNVLIGWINLEPSTSFNDTFDGFSKEQILAWLEKQGNKPQGKSALEAIKEEKVDDKVEPKDYNDIDPHFGKPIDKVEPKFKVGDWVVQGHNILKIKCVGNTHYCFETVGGYVDDMLVSEIDSHFHLWNIQDAKDGDVLSYRNGQWIFIFKRIDKYYALWSTIDNDLTIYGSTFSLLTNSIYPATKEQRDLLFQKMKEAGYEWDAYEKKLKEIPTL